MSKHFSKREKKDIQGRLKHYGIRQIGDVFNMINHVNQGHGDYTKVDVYDLIGQLIQDAIDNQPKKIELREHPLDYEIFGSSLISKNAIEDMDTISKLPYVTKVAVMADSHRVRENTVPVGGVVETEDQYIPSIVGSDISCSVGLTHTNIVLPNGWFDDNLKKLKHLIKENTYFGREINSNIPDVPELSEIDEAYLETTMGKELLRFAKKMVATEFGTSGDGNHFFEIGLANIDVRHNQLFSSGNQYTLSLLSHFGSRVLGSTIAKAFIKEANSLFEMPKGIDAAPLDMNTPLGRDYYTLMQFCGLFAELGHRWLHENFMRVLHDEFNLVGSTKGFIYTRHNYLWKTDGGIVHRKGATPAAYGEYGVIPATMGHNSQVVIGLGNEESIESASHGAGRTHSRGRAMQEFGKDNTHDYLLREHGVHLIGGGSDEDPRAYKNINDVMAEQQDCVHAFAEFQPKIVRMAPPRIFGKRRKK